MEDCTMNKLDYESILMNLETDGKITSDQRNSILNFYYDNIDNFGIKIYDYKKSFRLEYFATYIIYNSK